MQSLALEIFSRGFATILGFFLFIATTISLLRTAVVPRALHSYISDGVSAGVRNFFWGIARLRKDYFKRDAVLSWTGPLIIIALLISWLILYMLAFGLWIYGLGGGDLGDALRQSGSSLFTLGFADSNAGDQTALDFAAAATGPIVIALLIGFLPTIYSAYISREEEVTLLGTTAGQPAWGPEFLARLAMTDRLDVLNNIYTNWIQWAAAMRLTHVTYPMLLYVRSAKPNRSWSVSLLAILDAASMQLAVNRSLPRAVPVSLILHGSQALEVLYVTLLYRRGWKRRIPIVRSLLKSTPVPAKHQLEVPGLNRQVIAVELASEKDTSMSLPPEGVQQLRKGEELEITLTREEFDEAVAYLKEAGFPVEVEGDDAWNQFRLARSRYEFSAYAVCKAIDAVPAPWSGPRRIPTPVIWPERAVDVMKKLPPTFDDTTEHPSE